MADKGPHRAMWLTKVPTTDSHVVVTAGGHLVACRSVRASSQVWDGSMKDVLQKHAWDYPGLMAGAIAVAQAKGREVLPVADVFPLVDDGAFGIFAQCGHGGGSCFGR